MKTFSLPGKLDMEPIIRYEIETIEPEARRVRVRCRDLPTGGSVKLASPDPLPRSLVEGLASVTRNGPSPDVQDCVITYTRPPRSTLMPQLLPRFEPHWAVLPLWSVLPQAGPGMCLELRSAQDRVNVFFPLSGAVDFDEAAFLCLYAGMEHKYYNLSAMRLDVLAPDIATLDDTAKLSERVWQALTTTFGQSGLDRLVLSFEPQSPRLRLDKGLALVLGRLACCRFVPRRLCWDGSAPGADLADLVAHELAHIFTESTAPAGSWLTEGLTTYLARRLLIDHGIVEKRHMGRWLRRAQRNTRRNPHAATLSLRQAERRFTEPRAANLVYNQGFLAGVALDAALGGTLTEVTRGLFQQATADGRPFSEEDFRDALGSVGRDYYDRMLARPGLPAPLPGQTRKM